eukprot:12731090-Alexandrium_andersonii.AAC.1
MEAALYRNMVAVGVGREFRRATAIPQGCPWSMLATAIWATPWLRMLRALPGPVSGRVLADDLLLMTEGPSGEDEEAFHNHSTALEAT